MGLRAFSQWPGTVSNAWMLPKQSSSATLGSSQQCNSYREKRRKKPLERHPLRKHHTGGSAPERPLCVSLVWHTLVMHALLNSLATSNPMPCISNRTAYPTIMEGNFLDPQLDGYSQPVALSRRIYARFGGSDLSIHSAGLLRQCRGLLLGHSESSALRRHLHGWCGSPGVR